MKAKNLFQVFVVLAVLLSALGTFSQASAEAAPAAVVVVRDLTYWDAAYAGYVTSTRYEKWPLQLTATEDFSVTATPDTAGFTPKVILLDASGAEIASASGKLVTSQPVGSYYVQIQPEAGSGFYTLSIRREEPVVTDPSSTTAVTPASIKVGETTAVSVSLDNIPAEGYTSAEFSCTYDPSKVVVSGIALTDVFGADAASAIKDPQNGSLIVAVAGSNGHKATAGGAAITFVATALSVGEASIACQVRVSKGDNVLTEIASTAATLTITDVVVVVDGTVTGQVLAGKPVTVNLYDATDVLVKSAPANIDGTFSLTAPAGAYKVVAIAEGFLRAQGAATIVAGESAAKAAVTLLAGDIDANDVVDQYDAMTIGMNYNAAAPTAADLNNDGVINVLDLELVAAHYRQTGPLAWE